VSITAGTKGDFKYDQFSPDDKGLFDATRRARDECVADPESWKKATNSSPRKLTAPGQGKSRGFVIGHCPLPALGGSGERRVLAFLGVAWTGLGDVTERTVPFLETFGLYLLFAAILGLLVYGIVRAIGWVIGGFAA
jgi:hypothetical protein